MNTKQSISYLILSVFIFSFAIINAQQEKKSSRIEQAELSYIQGLTSPINGIRVTCAYYLGELKSENAVSSLIDMMRYDRCAAAKIIAAYSLINIGNEDGIAELKKIRAFNPPEVDDNEECIRLLSQLFEKYLQQNPTEAISMRNIKIPETI